jgi:hypothetical protein
MVSISLTASKGFTAVVSCISGQGGVGAVIPASTEQKRSREVGQDELDY